MPTNIFSTYSTGENRVTASILAVLQSLSLGRIERLLGALLEESEFELVRFQNQIAGGGSSVPDAVVLSSCRLLVETKIKPNSVDAVQIEDHLRQLNAGSEARRVLLVLTPDAHKPVVFNQFIDPLLYWSSFAALDQAIDELLADPHEVVSEREAFLLRELQAMLLREKLLATENDVVVVAARHAWPEYQRHHAYVCQADRPFQAVKRLAFYSSGQIYPLVPRILEVHERVEFTPERLDGDLRRLVEGLLADGTHEPGEEHKVMLLSPSDSSDTVNLGQPIKNDIVTEAGRPWAFVLGQRYVSLDKLKQAKTTSDVVRV